MPVMILGFSKPAMPESIANLMLSLGLDTSGEMGDAIIPVNHACSTI
jgi:hypothetical protein